MFGAVRADLIAWNRVEFGHVGGKVLELQTKLEWLELQLATPDHIQAMKNIRINLNCWLEKEDEMWHQRLRLNWFQACDKNTSFFHAKASRIIWMVYLMLMKFGKRMNLRW